MNKLLPEVSSIWLSPGLWSIYRLYIVSHCIAPIYIHKDQTENYMTKGIDRGMVFLLHQQMNKHLPEGSSIWLNPGLWSKGKGKDFL